MKPSALLQRDHEEIIAWSQRMQPDERLMAYFYHAQLIAQMYQAGVRYRSGLLPPSKQPLPRKR